jgi:transcription elongation GreA/GreB family factor
LLDQRIAEAEQAIAAAQASRNEDTKSSAGDKFETGREMMQMEINKNELQRSKALVLKQELGRVQWQKENQRVEFGSLVRTAQETYFMAIGLGKVQVDGEWIFAISMASPIGAALQGKSVGEHLIFQGREITIRAIS